MMHSRQTIQVVFFDFSGVLAEEGFVQGLKEIGRQHGLDPDAFLRTAADICYDNGYASGDADEHAFWQDLREHAGITGTDETLRREILSRFVIRPWMLQVVSRVRNMGPRTALLSDHTNWLEELDAAHGIFRHFDRVFNSYREGMTKRSTAFFRHACSTLQVAPEHTLFIDDNPANTRRAHETGMYTVTYGAYNDFAEQIRHHMPELMLPPEGSLS